MARYRDTKTSSHTSSSNNLLAMIAAATVVVVLGIIIFLAITGTGTGGNTSTGNTVTVSQPTVRTIIVVVDWSISAEKIREILARWIKDVLEIADPDSRFVLIRMARTSEIILELDSLPTMSRIKKTFDDNLKSFEPTPGTFPALTVETVSEYALARPYEDISVIFFTDGENDDPGNSCGKALWQSCRDMSLIPNITAVGVFGVNPETTSEWQKYLLPFGQFATVRGKSGTEDGISYILRKANEGPRLRRQDQTRPDTGNRVPDLSGDNTLERS